MHYVYHGKASLIFEDEIKVIEQGEICLITPYSKYKIMPDNEDDLIITIYIRNSTFDQLFFDALTQYDLISQFIRNIIYSHQSSSNYLLFKNTYSQSINEIIQNIFIETNYDDKYSNDASIHWTHLLFITILRDCQFKHSYFTFSDEENSYFYEILNYVEEHYNTVSLKDLSQQFHYNEAYLSTLFSSKLNMKFTHLITNLKMTHAKTLLINSDMSINDISQVIGYGSVDHFSRTFKKTTGLSPSDFRKDYSQTI